MITLAIETSTSRGSVALLDDGALILDEKFVADRSHSASLFTVLERARGKVEKFDQIAIGLGPGSYAGVRIAIAAAIGLELSLGAKLLGLASVAALETAASSYVAIGDARRETFYFTHVENGVCREGPLLATRSELNDRLANCEPLPIFASELLADFPTAQIALPSALILARLAQCETGIFARDILVPIYLREPHITVPRAR